ncbi:MAG: FkbM family methyltransferase [Pseudomonadota bacterium]
MKTGLRQLIVARLLRWAGALLARSGHTQLVGQLFQTADQLAPRNLPQYVQAHALWREGRQEEARTLLERILVAQPDHPEANNLLGAYLLSTGDTAGARAHFERALAVRPAFPAAHNNLGNIHLAGDELEEAARCYHAALAHNPNYVEALTNLGSIYNMRGENAAAERYCRKAVELAPDFAGAHCNLGNALLSQARTGEAVACYREALRLSPGLPEALVNLALVLQDARYLPGALEYYERLSRRRPNDFLPHIRIAQALQVMGRWDEAADRLERARELKPDSTEVLNILAANYIFVGDVRAGMAYLQRLLDIAPSHADTQSRLVFHSMYYPDLSGKALREGYREWAELYATRPLSPPPAATAAVPERRLRIGYVSRDFYKHPVAYFLEPILRQHDHAQFEVYCYPTLLEGDQVTERFKMLADHWRDISTLSEEAATELIRKDRIDILVDLSGHTTGNRLGVFARKPAAIQLNYLGHPATSGLDTMDYRLGDAVSDPKELTAGHYTETLWQLPHCFLTYQPPDDAPPILPPPCAATGHVTFGSFNNLAKVNEQVIAVWSKVLAAVPDSRLMLKSFALSSVRGRKRIVDGFAAHGIPEERLDLVGWRAGTNEHLSIYNKVDIALDTFPYNGTTTTCEALWMGVPVVCLEGERHSARVGASLLNALGLRELLAGDAEEFVRIAAQLAADTGRLAALRAGLRERMQASPLLDHAGFTRNLEAAYRDMWRTYCARRREEAAAAVNAATPDRSIALDLAGIARIRLPDSCQVMSRYVIEERGDWFEDEIRFVRRLLGPGQRALDIGANYGVYTLSMAALVGPSGSIYAFEPDPETASMLRKSLAENGFGQVQVIERAVSDRLGRGYLRMTGNSELNQLVDGSESGDADLAVSMTTLDHCRGEFGWQMPDFIKIDAEGQEPQVVRGAACLLTEASPLVMAEYKHGRDINHEVIEALAALGYQPYRLVPGLLVLAPVAEPAALDPYQLNLFFCKRDKAQTLASQGFLVMPGSATDAAGCSTGKEYGHALACHARSADTKAPPALRLAALEQALACAQRMADAEPSIPHRLTLARILADLGMRERACAEFDAVFKALKRNDEISAQPFLPPPAEFDAAACPGELRSRLLAAVGTWLARNREYSSFFAANTCLRYWQAVRASGCHADEAQRNIDLILHLKRSAVIDGTATPAF